MPRGAAVIPYQGKRGTVWRLKFSDVDGRQVMQTLGSEADGWTRQRAERELGKRLDLVSRERWRKPARETFADFAERFQADYLPGRNLKPSTLIDYRATIRLHLLPHFGDLELAAIEPAAVDTYITTKRNLSPKTVNNHLTLLGLMFKVAQRWRLVTGNPVELVDRPRSEPTEIEVLTEAEIARLLTGYRELEADPPADTETAWWGITRRLVTVALGTALRRGELLGLCWQDVRLVERLLTVRQAYVRGEFGTPKSRASRRTIELGPRVAAALEEQWQATSLPGR